MEEVLVCSLAILFHGMRPVRVTILVFAFA